MRGLTRRSGAVQPYTGGLQPMFSMLDDLRREFDRFFQDAETMLPMPAATTGANWAAFVPPVDIHETESNYTVKAEIPGIAPDDIDVRLEGNTLIIRGERQQERDEDVGTMHRSERTFGSFSRAFTLPQDVETDAINATFRNGVLAITVPKSHPKPGKQVQIQQEEGASSSRQIGQGDEQAKASGGQEKASEKQPEGQETKG